MKNIRILAMALFCQYAVNGFCSSEESKFKYAEDAKLSEIAKKAQAILKGKVSKHSVVYYFRGAIVTREEGIKKMSAQSDNDYQPVVLETTATIFITRVLKGPISGQKVTLRWYEIANSDCLHIPMRAPFIKSGIWLILNKESGIAKGHQVEWIFPTLEQKLSEILDEQELNRALDSLDKGQ